jgi:hypothetical protein
LSNPSNESELITEIIKEAKGRLKEAFQTHRLDWEYVPEQDPWPWRAIAGNLWFYLPKELSKVAPAQVKKECVKHSELKKVTSVAIRGRKITFFFSPST